MIVSAPPRALRSTALDVVGVHDDVAEVAGEAQAAAVGRGLEDLAAGAAVEQHRVGAGLALDGVAAVARIPLEVSSPAPEEGDVVALLAVDEVVAVAAEQQVGAVAAEQRVAAGAAVDRDPDERGQVAGRREAVVAAVGVEDEVLGACRCRSRTAPGRGGRSGRACRWPSSVNCSAPPPPLTSTVSVPAPPSLRSVSSPGFQIMRSSPLWPKTWSSASPPVSVSFSAAAEEEVDAAAAEQRVVAGLAEQLVAARAAGRACRCRTPPNRFARGSAPLASSRTDRVVAGLAEDLDQRRCWRRSACRRARRPRRR